MGGTARPDTFWASDEATASASKWDHRQHRQAKGSTVARLVRGVFPLSIRVSLVIVVLIPLAMAVGLGSTLVLHQSSIRRQAVTAQQSSLVLDSLLRARVDIYAEYVPSAATLAAKQYNLTDAQLNALLGVDFQATMAAARRQVDQLAVFGPTGVFAAQYAQLVTMRKTVDQKTTSYEKVQQFFAALGVTIDAQWQRTFTQLNTSGTADSPTTRSRLTALGRTFAALTSGYDEESLKGGRSLETVLTSPVTPAEIQSLVVSHQQYEEAVRGFPAGLGPQATTAWAALNNNRLAAAFPYFVTVAIAVGLGHETPPFATNTPAIAAVGRSEVAWAASLTNLVLASSSDLRVATQSQAEAATRALILVCVVMLALMLIAIGAALNLGRHVRRPLARIVAAAESVREGELDLPPLDESGPREIALAAGAFNEMTSTLRAVQAQAIALSAGDLEASVLQRSLPGRTGAALQSTINKLQMSVRANESQREALSERATRDSLTGLLNRGAALEALELGLAGVRRSNGETDLTVLFIDVDGLKMINDSLGHDRGDAAICAVADSLRAVTRASDVVSRFGGDEFVVGWVGTRGDDEPRLLVNRIHEQVALSTIRVDDHDLGVGCSIGVAVSEPQDTNVEALIERADDALYAAKRNGRGQVRWYGPDQADPGGPAPSDGGGAPATFDGGIPPTMAAGERPDRRIGGAGVDASSGRVVRG